MPVQDRNTIPVVDIVKLGKGAELTVPQVLLSKPQFENMTSASTADSALTT